jgi:thiamine pyrophosphate-dependent acetolactate synthase large subunit-like protein
MSEANLLDRRSVVGSLLVERKDAIVVGGLGASTYDIAAAGDHDRNLYLWGAMGGAVMIGLGLALAQPDLPVVVITGDGEMLMGMGSLATVGLQKPGNLTIVVLDNEVYGETGGQASHTAGTADLVGIAKACGIADARAMATMADIENFARSMQDLSSGPRFASIKIDSANLERVLSSRDGTFIVTRIRGALGFGPIRAWCGAAKSLTFAKVSAYSQP